MTFMTKKLVSKQRLRKAPNSHCHMTKKETLTDVIEKNVFCTQQEQGVNRNLGYLIFPKICNFVCLGM